MPQGCSPLSHDPTSGIECHRPDDRFIPIRASELARALALDADRFGVASEALLEVTRGIQDVIDQEATAFVRLLGDSYTPFNPDCDTLAQADVALARTPESYRDLNTRIAYLLTKANFIQLSEAQIQSAVKTANSFGLRVRLCPERLAHLEVWVRGRSHIRRRLRTWRHPIKGCPYELLVHRRLAIITRLNSDPYVNLKLFKEIPITDVEALLPHADVQMTWMDRLKLFGGGAGMIGSTGLKVAKLLGTIVYWSRLLWIVLGGAVLLTYRVVTGYRYACTMRNSMRTQHLYYQNLDNNAGVIHTLISMIAQEEVKEGGLAYCFCLASNNASDPESGTASGHAVRSTEDLRARVAAYLSERFGVAVNFDVDDAIETIGRLGLWSDRERFRVVDPPQAVQRLRAHWQNGLTLDYHQGTAGRTGA